MVAMRSCGHQSVCKNNTPSLIQGLQICKQLCRATAMVHLKLVKFIFVDKQVMLPATLPDIESEIYFVKILFLPK